MSNTQTPRKTHSERLLDALRGHAQILVVMHDNPDPDAIASGWGLHCLVREKLKLPVRLVGGGAIVRAENRLMVERLSPPIELVDELTPAPGAAAVLVDCGPAKSNQLLTRAGIQPLAVVDHHQEPRRRKDPRLAFRDIRPRAAASATIVASYLREQQIEPGVPLSTAMLYALRTEVIGTPVRFSRLDRSIVVWLTRRSDPELLSEIEQAPLSRDYFADLVLAMQNTFLYDDAALCLLPRAEGADTVGEVADLLIRCQGVRRVLCGASVGGDLLISVRTGMDADNATTLLRQVLNGLGGSGGHDHRSGGKISGVGRDGRIPESLEDELRTRWLAACQVDRQRGTRLVARREIVENLRV